MPAGPQGPPGVGARGGRAGGAPLGGHIVDSGPSSRPPCAPTPGAHPGRPLRPCRHLCIYFFMYIFIYTCIYVYLLGIHFSYMFHILFIYFHTIFIYLSYMFHIFFSYFVRIVVEHLFIFCARTLNCEFSIHRALQHFCRIPQLCRPDDPPPFPKE